MYDISTSYKHDGGICIANHSTDILSGNSYKVFYEESSLRNGDFDESYKS